MYRKPTAYTGRKSSMTLGLPESRKTLKNSVFRFITYNDYQNVYMYSTRFE